jgi:hypothetical protein
MLTCGTFYSPQNQLGRRGAGRQASGLNAFYDHDTPLRVCMITLLGVGGRALGIVLVRLC